MVEAATVSHQSQSTFECPIQKLSKPAWLVEGNLSDDVWIVETEEPNSHRHSRVKFDFAVPILPGPILLNDPTLANDHLTAKLFVYYSLSASHGWCSVAKSALGEYHYLINFFRWRWDRGIQKTQDLNGLWLSEYQESLRAFGLEGLLNSNQKVATAIKQLVEEKAQAVFRGNLPDMLITPMIIYNKAGFSFRSQVSDEAYSIIKVFLDGESDQAAHKSVPTQEHAGLRRIDKQNLHSNHLTRYLLIWQKLWKLREKLSHDPISFKPFVSNKSASKVAISICSRESAHTPEAPAFQTCFLVDRALRWVLLYSQDIQDYASLIEKLFNQACFSTQKKAVKHANKNFEPKFTGPDHPGAPWPILSVFQSDKLDGGLSLNRAMFALLPAACAIVIAAFSARRKEELESLKEGCLVYEDGDPFMEVWIAKTLRQYEKIPIPSAVARALEVLEWLSEPRRRATNVEWLFDFESLVPYAGTSRKLGFNFGKSLSLFSDFVDVPPLADGRKWHFAPHQFRRFFSIIYFYRWRYASLNALSGFLKHYNLDTTRHYITAVASGSLARIAEETKTNEKRDKRSKQSRISSSKAFHDFEEGAQNFKLDRLKSAYLGTEQMAGFGGEFLTQELKEWVERASRNIRIGAFEDDEEDTLDELILEFASRISIEPNALEHSYCKCGSHRADVEAASCVKLSSSKAGNSASMYSGPDLVYASDLVCSGCPHNVQLPENARYWEELIHEQTQAIKLASSESAKRLAEKRLQGAESHYRRCFSQHNAGFSNDK